MLLEYDLYLDLFHEKGKYCKDIAWFHIVNCMLNSIAISSHQISIFLYKKAIFNIIHLSRNSLVYRENILTCKYYENFPTIGKVRLFIFNREV